MIFQTVVTTCRPLGGHLSYTTHTFRATTYPFAPGLRVLGVAVRQRLADHGVLAWE